MAWPNRRHSELVRVSERVWRVEGSLPGMLLNRQMIVVRDARGQLLLHSVVSLDERRLQQLLMLGQPTWMVVPNGYHRLDAAAYKARFPALTVVAPSGAMSRVRKVVPVDLAYEEFPAHPEICFHSLPSQPAKEGAVEVRERDKVILVFTDLLFNPYGSGAGERFYRLLRQRPQVPWLARRMLSPDRALRREWLLQLACIEGLSMLVPGHGDPIGDDAPEALRCIAERL